MADPAIPNSSYLDFTAYRATSATTVTDAYGLDPAKVQLATGTPFTPFNVAITLDRNQDPTTLLAQDWATRQQTLDQLNASGTLWTTYGADQATFDGDVAALRNRGLTVLDANNAAEQGNYVTSAESRTIWVEINTPQQFESLFGTPLYTYVDPASANDGLNFWNGNLSLPASWNVDGLWIDSDRFPPTSNLHGGTPIELPQGQLSIGSTNTPPTAALPPQDIAALYHFPLSGSSDQAGTIGLIEPIVGTALPGDATQTFEQLLDSYLAAIGAPGAPPLYTQGEDGQLYREDYAFERSVDVGTVAAIDPRGKIGLYAGSGTQGNATGDPFTSFQSAIWDTANNPSVLSASFTSDQQSTPDSPFYRAYAELFVDVALRNQSLFTAAGDEGSNSAIGNGLANIFNATASPYVVAVGGTSLATPATATTDPTIVGALLAPALAGDPSTIWGLVAGGLTSFPTAGSLQYFLETAWNEYSVDGSTTDLSGFGSTGGGVDTTRPTPSYQSDFGLDPVTADPTAESGRGVPDVSAAAGGLLAYLIPNEDLSQIGKAGGTSLSTPLWAALTRQINTVFEDQSLPDLGYMNDLLYIAAAIAPASFNDVRLGNNASSYSFGGSYQTVGPDGETLIDISPTGLGYQAGPGYDLTTGLGTPDGLLLARALTDIAHAQMSFADEPAVIDKQSDGSWTSGADQSVLLQSRGSAGAGPYAWTSRLAEQSLQPDFDPTLVLMFDQNSQGALAQTSLAFGQSIGFSFGGTQADAPQASLTSPFGFADFVSADGSQSTTVARPVMVAETAGGADDQTAIVRMRSDGRDSLYLQLYRVDDFNGTIDGVVPGQAGYAAAAQERAYDTATGGSLIKGPAYGNYGEAEIVGVNAGDLVAMELINSTHGTTYFEFDQANESIGGTPVAHTWNYGLNTLGWEDTWGGGDRDYNDLVVGVDFTSKSGHALLA